MKTLSQKIDEYIISTGHQSYLELDTLYRFCLGNKHELSDLARFNDFDRFVHIIRRHERSLEEQ